MKRDVLQVLVQVSKYFWPLSVYSTLCPNSFRPGHKPKSALSVESHWPYVSTINVSRYTVGIILLTSLPSKLSKVYGHECFIPTKQLLEPYIVSVGMCGYRHWLQCSSLSFSVLCTQHVHAPNIHQQVMALRFTNILFWTSFESYWSLSCSFRDALSQ